MINPDVSPIGVSWTPILTDSLLSEALASVEELSAALVGPGVATSSDPSLATGTAGLALFYAFLSETRPDLDRHSSRRAMGLLDQAILGMTTLDLPPGFYSGFPGIAWTLEHLQDRLIERDQDDPNGPIDQALALHLGRTPWRADYDLISGLVGYGVYALARRHSAERRAFLATIVRRLAETSTETADGVSWFTQPHLLTRRQRQQDPNGFYNLGLAHGVPGVIAFLAQACAENIEPETAGPLLEGAVSWLLARENRSEAGTFPTMLSPEGRAADDTPARIAWCYGDLGLATALLWAARSVGNSGWEQEAVRIATRAARRPLRDSRVVDAGLCHGAAGNGHLFNRLYQATRNAVFLDAARRYFEQALRLRRPGEGVAGYVAWLGADAGGWKSQPGLLEGAAGVGLALLAAVSSVEPEWDRMLMISVPPR